MRGMLAGCVCLALTCTASAQEGDKIDKLAADGLQALTHPDPAVRCKSADLLGRLGKVARFAIPALRDALKDGDAHVRVKAAEALWKVEQPPLKVVLPVLVGGLTDKQASARALAAKALAEVGPPARAAVPALGRALADKDVTVRMEAVLALGEMGPAARSA